MNPYQEYPAGAARFALCAIAVVVFASAPANAAQASCESLAQFKVDHGEIATAQAVPAGPFTVQGFMGARKIALPAFCSVKLTLRPTSDSDIRIEVWLPASGWNGRLEAVGNGGLAGSIGEDEMAGALGTGYATTGTDTGHAGSPITGDWALGHPEKVIDFGYRAVHLMTVEAKALIAAYYGSPAKYAYWNGCSEGGGQALSEAQRFPDDYDGILAGAPANYFNHLQMGGNWISQAIHEDPASMISPAKLPAITAAVLADCDALDGVKDGVLEDPRQCHFDPGKLLCKGDENNSCLTAPQIAGLKKVYDGAKNPRTGAQVFPGLVRGGEAGWGFWVAGTQAPPMNAQHLIMVSGLSNLVFDGPKWDWKTFDFDQDVAFADKKVGGAINQINPDLSGFKKHGGKLFQYHGWNDPAISPLNSIDYFNSVQKKMGDTSDFYRLFMIPGMEHCMGGPGASDFDHMNVIVKWVEDGVAPDRVVAKRGTRTHPLCPYPKVAKYNGSDSTDDAANFSCAAE
jgi:Tannase and feruloyl esterase